MDVRQMAAFHAERRSDITIASVAVPIAQASSFGILGTDADGRVREFREKPRQPCPIPGDPARAFASMGNYLFKPEALEHLLDEACNAGDTDFGRDVLPRAIAGGARTYAYDFAANRVPGLHDYEERAYWRDVGTLSALAAAQQDSMGQQPRFNLWNRRWPIRGEHDATLLAKLREWKERAEPRSGEFRPSLGWRAAGTDRRTDERLTPS
jgi:glucose-1-phosphate adenylyltransferase